MHKMMDNPEHFEGKTCDWIKRIREKYGGTDDWPPPIVGIEYPGREQINTQELYDEHYEIGQDDLRRMRYMLQFSEVKKKVFNSQTFIDVGGGPGRNMEYLCLYLKKHYPGNPNVYTVLDFSHMAKGSFYKHERNKLAEFVCTRMEDFDTKHKYDVVMCFETLEHLDSLEVGMQKLWDITADDGMLLCSTPHGYMKDGKTHMSRSDHDGIFHTAEYIWKVPLTFYPWVWAWSHVYFSAIKRESDVNQDPIDNWVYGPGRTLNALKNDT